MSESFHVGETAILINTEYFPEYENSECTIMSALQENEVVRMDTLETEVRLSYKIMMKVDGMRLTAAPHQLKKKTKPIETKTKELETTL